MLVNGLHVTSELAKWRENAQDGAIRSLRGRPQAVMLCVCEHAKGLGKSPNGTLMFCVNLIPKHAIFKILGVFLIRSEWQLWAHYPSTHNNLN